jgi:hypothetical protein
MPTNAQVSQTDLQRYLEQLYKGYYSNASPALQGGFDNIASYDAGVDSQPNPKPLTSYTPPKVPLAPVGTLDRMNFPQQQLPAPPPFTTGTSSHMPPGGYPTYGAGGPEQLHDSGISQILARMAANSKMSNAIPNMNLSQPTGLTASDKAKYTTQANKYVDSLIGMHNNALDAIKTAQDQIKTANAPDPLAAIEAQIRGIAGTPDIPEHWVSPYSQAYLDQLGQRLGEAGSQAQTEFNAAKGDVVQNYAQGNQVRDTTNAALANELQGAGGNIGINYAQSNQGQKAASDAAYLSQMSGANQATDTSFMDKMGQMAALSGSNLGMQAKEGLLTPKQFVGRQSGLSSGQQALLNFLGSKYSGTESMKELQARIAAGQYAPNGTGAGSTLPGVPQIAQTADTSQTINNPDFVAAFSQLAPGPTKDLIQQYYDSASGNVADALSAAQKASQASIAAGATGFPLGRTGIVPRGASTPQGGGLDLAAAYAKAVPVQGEGWAAVLDFLRKYDPAWNPVTTSNQLGTKSTTKYS